MVSCWGGHADVVATLLQHAAGSIDVNVKDEVRAAAGGCVCVFVRSTLVVVVVLTFPAYVCLTLPST